MKFRTGQEVVCIISDISAWVGANGEHGIGPKRGEVLVLGYVKPDAYLLFHKYGDMNAYSPKSFIELIRPKNESVCEDLLRRFPMIEERPDYPEPYVNSMTQLKKPFK